MKTIAIIPARGGSKRIPRKNIKDFLGKPIITYSIEAALESKLFDEVMVSTDDEEIAEIAKSYGAIIPFMRGKRNSNDFATTVDVIVEVLQEYRKQGKTFEYGCCIYPTAPFVNKLLLENALNKFVSENLDSVFPVLPFSFPIQRAVRLVKENKIEMFHSEHLLSRSQDLEKAYHDAGQFYWFKTEIIFKKEKLWTDNSGGIIISELEAHDIDNMEDWKIAEFKYKVLNNVF